MSKIFRMIGSVYQKILGTEFGKLGPNLKISHGETINVTAKGIIDVEYGKNIFVGLLNKISKMPPKGLNQNVTLTITRSEDKETWKRDFNGKIFLTYQMARNGFMIESSGIAALVFKLTVKEGNIHFQQEKLLMAGIKMPGFLGLNSIATSSEYEGGWRVMVEVRSPLFGLMLRYNGFVKLES